MQGGGPRPWFDLGVSGRASLDLFISPSTLATRFLRRKETCPLCSSG